MKSEEIKLGLDSRSGRKRKREDDHNNLENC